MWAPLTLVAAGHVLGLCVAAWAGVAVPAAAWLLPGMLPGAWLLSRRSGRAATRGFLVASAFVLGWLGAGEVAQPPPPTAPIAVRLELRVIRTPGPPRPSRTRSDERVLTVLTATRRGRPLTVHVSLPGTARAPAVRAGEWWWVSGMLHPRAEPTNPGPRDRRAELARRGSTQVLRVRHPDALLQAGHSPPSPIRRLQEWLRRRLRRAAGPDAAPILASLLLGDRDGLDPELRDAFTAAGIGHLLVVSGLHVLFLSAALARGLLAVPWLRRRAFARTACLWIVLLLYCGVCDFTTPVVRAAIFVGWTTAADALGRPAPFRDRLAPAVLCLLLAAPDQLLSPGFQLSFTAVLGLAFLRAPIRRALFPMLELWEHFPELVTPRRHRWTLRFADATSTTLAAQLGTLPVLVHWFGEAHPWALAANLMAVPIAALLVPAAAALALVGAAAPELTQPLASALVAPLSTLAESFAALPGARVALPPVTRVQVVASSGLLVLAGGLRNHRGWTLVSLVAAVGVLVLPLHGHALRARAGIHVIDVGHGVAVLLRDGRGHDVLVDAGGRTAWTTEHRLLPALRALGVRDLHALWLSHGDHDHCSGLAAVLELHPPDTIHVPVGFETAPPTATELRAAERAGVAVRRRRRGDRERSGGILIDVLHPPLDTPARSRNEASLVLRVEVRARDQTLRALLPGDVVGIDLDTLAADPQLGRCDLLLLPHHGRGPVDEQLALLARVRPRRSVACAADARHVVVPTWITGVHGAVSLTETGRFVRSREFVQE